MALSHSTSLPTLQSPFHKIQLIGISQNPRELTIQTAKTLRYPLVSLCHAARSNPQRISCVAGDFPEDGAREASSSPPASSLSIFVKGLADSVSEGRLKKVFSEFGEVSHVKIIVNERTRQSLGYGYVWFTKKDDAQLAVDAMNGKFFDGRFILVKFGQPGLSRRRRSHSDFLFFAYLEEHYKNGTSHNPPERQQHASLPRACMLYSDNNHAAAQQSSVEGTDGLPKCSIRDTERPRGADRNAQLPMSRVINVPQTIQGAAVAGPGKVVGSVLRYNNCGAATRVEALEQQQRRMVRNPSGASQYPKRTPHSCKSNRGDEDAEGTSKLKQNPQYIPQKVAAAQDNAVSRWY